MDLVARASQLRAARVPHAMATVVLAQAPMSAKPDDRNRDMPLTSAKVWQALHDAGLARA